MKKFEFEIKEQKVVFRKSYAGLMQYEKMTGQSIASADHSATCAINMIYCMLVALNKELSITLDEFVAWLDENDWIIDAYKEISQAPSKKKPDNVVCR